MKVSGPRNISGPSGAGKASKSAPVSGFTPQTPVDRSAAAEQVGSVAETTPVGSIDALMALQGADLDQSAQEQATERAFSLLDRLDDLKIALLEGTLPRETLERLVQTLQSERSKTNDPELESMLDEVELRAAVELAKHGG